ncbi:MAG: biopolymer transporter ExbD [Kiritimatiellae bacterium]|nr:biopolymer transporter ExbD [Kiritimatiellia bacterium]
MAYKKKANRGEKVELSMTPMIDVVFQLLIFFVVTLKQEDIFAKLTAARPAPNQNKEEATKQDPPITVSIGREGFFFNDRLCSEPELDRGIERISGFSKTAMVVIKCTQDSTHGNLVKVLNICYKHKMENLSIFSM